MALNPYEELKGKNVIIVTTASYNGTINGEKLEDCSRKWVKTSSGKYIKRRHIVWIAETCND